MQTIVVRFLPGQDLRKEIEKLVVENKIKAAVILSAVGSLSKANLRLAGAKESKTWDGDLEVVSATGTIARNGLHIHLAIADNKGDVFGGHLHQGCIVNTTVELIVGVLTDNVFTRELDKNTGWKELIVNN
ncbi:hypothetical protein COX08_02065 [Candidatus Beckwithbacteria bacterium CG23_combo_of_CG06-09_8_20_14_all_34_8]|uniref:PPC domain-containing protein n=1 Tax=Candidatus Beckwithbacteria bacterium CG23_combo_of_CG06-09_8_20_14_all_34_8 TaxID=1974497 RepID=A0A2H0B6I7_9BACT|nr:MAG: hypothetical protein COX08_02065 [Candidatus Beckwithbacteria bacterium CG23_combo_of_CG06-09_8_20_14_all_34_8]